MDARDPLGPVQPGDLEALDAAIRLGERTCALCGRDSRSHSRAYIDNTSEGLSSHFEFIICFPECLRLLDVERDALLAEGKPWAWSGNNAEALRRARERRLLALNPGYEVAE